ncbi:MAG: hypothetical protein O9972_57280 [Burkholderiales bacterium]|nr:hypothetical protein [Burkholderiales bacterium]
MVVSLRAVREAADPRSRRGTGRILRRGDPRVHPAPRRVSPGDRPLGAPPSDATAEHFLTAATVRRP